LRYAIYGILIIKKSKNNDDEFAKTKFVILSDAKHSIEGYYKSGSYVVKFFIKMESV
jgi:hypothetical protein